MTGEQIIPVEMQIPARVLWLVDSMAADAGTEQQILHLGSRIDRSRFQLQLVTLEASVRDSEISKSLPVVSFPVRRVWSPHGLCQIVRLADYIRRHRFQLVHGFTFKSSVVAAVAGNLARVPLVLTSRRNLGYYYTPRILSIVKLLNKRVTRVVANSEAARTVALNHEKIDGSKVDVLYNGVDCARFERPATGEGAVPLPEGKRIVGVVANYRFVKDLPLFLRAAALVAQQIPDAAFLLVGAGGQQPELERLAAELGIADKVIFTGGRGSVEWYLQHLSVACLSSHSEGFSNSILEYMASGLPVVATDVGGNREAVIHGETGYLVSERDPGSFADPVIRLLSNEGLRKQMGQNGQRVCRLRFRMEIAVATMERYYRSLIETGAPPVLVETAYEPTAEPMDDQERTQIMFAQ